MKYSLLSMLILVCCLALLGCDGRPAVLKPAVGGGSAAAVTRPAAALEYLSWDSTGQAYPAIAGPPVEASPAPGRWPIAGTVSHHLLVGQLIEDWFGLLAERRDVRTFLILSPSHWGLCTSDFSLTEASWRTDSGLVRSNPGLVAELASRLDAQLHPELFATEHGVDTFMPFISRHFPEAEVVALAYEGGTPIDMGLVHTLWQALEPVLSEGLLDGLFLLISVDFSHQDGPAETRRKDAVSRCFLEDPAGQSWILASCDNRPAMYALKRLVAAHPSARLDIIYHTDSFTVSGQDEHDITSYFFTLLSVDPDAY